MAAADPVPDLAGVAERLAALAEADPGHEVCGLVVEQRGALEVVPVRNAAGDGEGGPAASRHAFLLDAREHLAVARRMRAGGGRIVAVYHSHVDGPARLSAADREALAVAGVPVVPGADLVVIGMRGEKVREIGIFRWSGGEFVPAGVLSRR